MQWREISLANFRLVAFPASVQAALPAERPTARLSRDRSQLSVDSFKNLIGNSVASF